MTKFVGLCVKLVAFLTRQVVSTRYHKDILSLWTKHADDEELKEKVKAGLKKALGLSPSFDVEYRAHNQALQEAAKFPKPWDNTK